MKKLKLMLLIAIIALSMGLYGCGSDGAAGAPGLSAFEIAQNNGFTGTEAEFAAALTAANDATPESCALCHKGAGDLHQMNFDSTKDTSALALAFSGAPTVVGPDANGNFTYAFDFTVSYNGAAFVDSFTTENKFLDVGTQRWTLSVYDPAARTVAVAQQDDGTGTTVDATYTLTNNGSGNYTLTFTATDLSASAAYAYAYLAKDKVGSSFGHIQLYDNVSNAALTFGDWTGGNYASNVDVASCEACHGAPYMKHGYRAAAVSGLDNFLSCKSCHYSTRSGHSALEFFGVNNITDPTDPDYDPTDPNYDPSFTYTANIMTDVHASHLNVFPYPQEMGNCVTCHTGTKLTSTLTEANFKYSVCTTCHADVDATTNTVVAKPLSTILPTGHMTVDNTTNCGGCHMDTGGIAPSFATIHTGVDTVKYASTADAASGTMRYTYAIDTIVYDQAAATLTITWNAKDASGTAQDVLNLDGTGGAPVFLGLPSDRNNESEGIRVMVAYYGWGTKNVADYDNYQKDDVIANTTYDNTAGEATTTFALDSTKLTDTQATKLAVGIIGVPQVNGSMVAVKSVTKDILLADGTLSDRDMVVDNANCNACHDNIVIHTGDSHGHTTVGNVNNCLFCHNTSTASGHFEQQGRSLDSYLHAIHTFQTEPEFIFPMFTTTACDACHVAGTYNVPDQTTSLGSVIDGGVLSFSDHSDDVTVGPASRACGSCHRAEALKTGDTGMVAAINGHTETNGYRVPQPVKSFMDVITSIMDKL